MLADPLSVVIDLVTGLEPGLDRACITEVVTGVAGAGPNAAGSPRLCWPGRGFSPMADRLRLRRSGNC